jgi:hypothetical protein
MSCILPLKSLSMKVLNCTVLVLEFRSILPGKLERQTWDGFSLNRGHLFHQGHHLFLRLPRDKLQPERGICLPPPLLHPPLHPRPPPPLQTALLSLGSFLLLAISKCTKYCFPSCTYIPSCPSTCGCLHPGSVGSTASSQWYSASGHS